MITHVLDTSAVLAHYFDEAGSAEVNALLLVSDLAAIPESIVRQARLPEKVEREA